MEVKQIILPIYHLFMLKKKQNGDLSFLKHYQKIFNQNFQI